MDDARARRDIADRRQENAFARRAGDLDDEWFAGSLCGADTLESKSPRRAGFLVCVLRCLLGFDAGVAARRDSLSIRGVKAGRDGDAYFAVGQGQFVHVDGDPRLAVLVEND